MKKKKREKPTKRGHTLHLVAEYDDWALNWREIGYCFIPNRIINNRERRDNYIEKNYEQADFWISWSPGPRLVTPFASLGGEKVF